MFDFLKKKLVTAVGAAPVVEPQVVIVNRFVPAVVEIPAEFGGGLGVIDHFKVDGKFGVRPVDADGKFLPNQSLHWTEEQRASIPHELTLAYGEFKAVTALPEWAK